MLESETMEALQAAAEGLLYQSETDAPWTAFAWPTATGEPTAAGVRQMGRHPAGAPIAEQTLAEFFDPLTRDQDWYGDEERATAARYRTLREALKRYLNGAKVVRTGERKVALYVVGVANEGGWAGLKTTAVET